MVKLETYLWSRLKHGNLMSLESKRDCCGHTSNASTNRIVSNDASLSSLPKSPRFVTAYPIIVTLNGVFACG